MFLIFLEFELFLFPVNAVQNSQKEPESALTLREHVTSLSG